MDSRPIPDPDTSDSSAAPDAAEKTWSGSSPAPHSKTSDVRFPGEDGGRSLADMAQRDLTATLQLLAERAQYITGATGAAIALRDQDEMVCRASAGPSAPDVGTQLQVNSGLTGESVRTRQTLRCDDAFSDPRVNRESCEALGIRSVVVMPLLRGDEVIGVFELFSDQANVFLARDLVALERMGTMVHTALEHSTAALGLPPMLGEAIQPMRASQNTSFTESVEAAEPELPHASTTRSESPAVLQQAVSSSGAGVAFHGKASTAAGANATARIPSGASVSVAERQMSPAPASIAENDILEDIGPRPEPAPRAQARAPRAAGSFEELLARADQDPILSDVTSTEHESSFQRTATLSAQSPAATLKRPEAESPSAPVFKAAVANLKKCQECGFPVSEGRQLCLDCEKKKAVTGATAISAPADTASEPTPPPMLEPESFPNSAPTFMHSDDADASWISTHKFMVIALVLAGIGIAAVVALR